MRVKLILVLTGVLALSGGTPAHAFGTLQWLGQNAEHERITRRGLAQYGLGAWTMDQLAGTRGTFGAVGAPDRPDLGLARLSEAHCSEGDWLDIPDYPRSRAAARAMLEKCRTYIFVRMEAAAVETAMLVGPDLAIDASQALTATRCRFTDRERRAKCRVLKELGRAFHAIQDFYSHSNWTDPPRETVTLKTPPGLGHGEPAPWLESLDAAFPEGLISGCYEPILPGRDCAGRVLHRDMNKDTAEDPNSADGNYRRAIDVATEDTRRRWARFETRLIELYGAERGTRIACVVRNDDPAVCEQQA